MSKQAMLPCFVCGGELLNEFPDSENQPREGTEFRTYGHYGSTFWDSFDGEELVLNVCDDCLRERTHRLAQHKRYRPINADKVGLVGRQWVDRPMVPYTGHHDTGDVKIEPEEIGTKIGSRIEWLENVEEIKRYALQQLEADEPQPGDHNACPHALVADDERCQWDD